MKKLRQTWQWPAAVWAAVLLLPAMPLIPLSFIYKWPVWVLTLLWFLLAGYATALIWHNKILRKAVRVVWLVSLFLGLLASPLILMLALSGQSAYEYINSPGGTHTAVVVEQQAFDWVYYVSPAYGKVLYHSKKAVFVSKGDPPDTSQFVWLDEHTLQVPEGWGEKVETIRF